MFMMTSNVQQAYNWFDAGPDALESAAVLIKNERLVSFNRRVSAEESFSLLSQGVKSRPIPPVPSPNPDPLYTLARFGHAAVSAPCPRFVPPQRYDRDNVIQWALRGIPKPIPSGNLSGCVYVAGGAAVDLFRAFDYRRVPSSLMQYRQLLVIAAYEHGEHLEADLWRIGNYTEQERQLLGPWKPYGTEHQCLSTSLSSLVHVRRKLYAVGGLYFVPEAVKSTDGVDRLIGPTSQLCIFSIDSTTWEFGKPLPTTLAMASLGVIGTNIVVMFGVSSAVVSSVYIYNTEDDQWTIGKEESTVAKYVSNAFVQNSRVPKTQPPWTGLLAGDGPFRGAALPDMHSVNLWEPVPRAGAATVVVGSRIFLWGGFSDLLQCDVADTIVLWTGVYSVDVSQSLPSFLTSEKPSGKNLTFEEVQATMKTLLSVVSDQDLLCQRRDNVPCGSLRGAVSRYTRADSSMFVRLNAAKVAFVLTGSIITPPIYVTSAITVEGAEGQVAPTVFCVPDDLPLSEDASAFTTIPLTPKQTRSAHRRQWWAPEDSRLISEMNIEDSPCMLIAYDLQNVGGASHLDSVLLKHFKARPLYAHEAIINVVLAANGKSHALPDSPVVEMPFLQILRRSVSLQHIHISDFGFAFFQPPTGRNGSPFLEITSSGGGISSAFSSLTVSSVIFSRNVARRGGGLYALGGAVLLEACQFLENKAAEEGAGSSINLATAAFTNVEFADNWVGGTAIFSRSTVQRNVDVDVSTQLLNISSVLYGSYRGGALACTGSLAFVLQSCRFDGNVVALRWNHSQVPDGSEFLTQFGGALGTSYCDVRVEDTEFVSNAAGMAKRRWQHFASLSCIVCAQQVLEAPWL